MKKDYKNISFSGINFIINRIDSILGNKSLVRDIKINSIITDNGDLISELNKISFQLIYMRDYLRYYSTGKIDKLQIEYGELVDRFDKINKLILSKKQF